MPYRRFLNAIAKARKPSPIRQLTEILQSSPPSVISMASGMPNAGQFPFKQASFDLKDGGTLNISPDEMKKCLQYQMTAGLPELRNWLLELQRSLHSPPEATSWGLGDGETEFDVLVTTGSQHGLSTACEMLCTPKDKFLASHPLYSGTISIINPLGVKTIPLKCDGQGIIPEYLSEVLSRWPDVSQPTHNDSLNIPKVLYCVPNGNNPTGASLTHERKEEIYMMAQQYNLIILEDDPYYFIQFHKPRVPSFLSMDVDGRVLRFDSFSKVLSAGIRIGFVTGPTQLLEKINYSMQSSVLHTSAVSQMIIYKLLDKWGIDGFLDHSDKVTDFYKQRRDVMLAAANKHMTGLAEWDVPSGGMFFWMKLLGIDDTHDLIMNKARDKEVLLVPGSAFNVDPKEPSQYVRASYSLGTDEQIWEGMRRLSELVKEHQQT